VPSETVFTFQKETLKGQSFGKSAKPVTQYLFLQGGSKPASQPEIYII